MNRHGFELVREETIPELNSLARLYRHTRTGAELLSMENKDENKCFGVTFFTPPEDSTGLPHIMEHSVLGGSRKYQVREPFVELIKGSLNTFLNAMTFPDMTTYPVASQNLKDFYNLIDVYLDAVFYPLISEKTLAQEGWHYELADAADPMIYKGVVFNEMKGVYSSPDQLLGDLTQRLLMPDTIYGLDSGGDPEQIPNLTYQQFKRFHDTYYHPSNARFYFYGDDDPDERLRLIDAFIAEFDGIQIDRTVKPQPRFDAPRRVVRPYDASEEAEDSKKGMMTVAWLLTDTADLETGLALQILSHILVGTPASPLRKALIDSGLGEDLTGGGVSPYQKEMFFSTGLKGIANEDADKVETLIMETLANLAEEGIDKATVEASLNTIEFQMRELNTGRFPRGLALMLGAMPAWIHGADPIEAMKFEKPLEHIKEQAKQDGFFEELVGKYFIDNPHRSTVILEPDPALREQREAAERERIEQARAAMDEAEIQKVIENTAELKRIQETPDTPEALASIPSLSREDLDREIKTLPIDVQEVNGAKTLFHDLPTNGILYLDLGFDLHTLPAELLPYVKLFGRALTEIGTESEDFVRLSQRIGQKTGGVWTQTFTSVVPDTKASAVWMFLRGKVMAAQAGDLLDILRDVLLTVKLDNPGRFKQMVLEEKAGKESGISFGGHSAAAARIRAHFDEADWAAEQMGGISNLFFLRELATRIDTDWPSVLAALEQIRTTLLTRAALLVNVTVEADNWAKIQPGVAELVGALPAGNAAKATWTMGTLPKAEGLTIPAQVNYVGKGGNLYDLGYQLSGSYLTILQYVGTTYMWSKIRAQGGAYGGFANFDRASGNFAYLSYRDPNLLKTLDNYDGLPDFLKNLELSEDELTRSIIGAVGELDTPLLPDAKGFTSMLHYLTGYTNEQRQQFRDQVLGTTLADFKAFGEALAKLVDTGVIAVVGSQAAIEAANAERGNFLTITKVL
jgi:Zn-dependent M16 (insulinase) family peptidase